MHNQQSLSRLSVAVYQAMGLQLCLAIFQLYFLRSDPFFANSVGDAAYYLQSAQQLWAGQSAGGPLFYAPGMTFIRFILLPLGTGPWPYHLLALAAGMGLTGCIVLLSGRAGRLCVPQPRKEKAALISARLATLLWLACPMGLFFQAEPVFPLWAAFGVTGALALLSWSKNSSSFTCFTAGLCIGCASLGQTSLLILAPLIGLWLWLDSKNSRNALSFFIGACAPFLPVFIYHFSLQEFVLLRTAGGFNFLIGNECGSAGVFHVPKGMSSAFSQASLPDVIRGFASPQRGPLVSAAEADRILYARGLNEWSHCGLQGTLSLYLRKLYLLVCASEIGIHRQQLFADQWVPFRRYLFVNQAWLVAGTLPALYILLRQRLGRLLLLTAFGIVLSTLPFFVADRLRFPLLCICVILTASGLTSLAMLPIRRRLLWLSVMSAVTYGLHRSPNVPKLYRLEALEYERLGALYANQQSYEAASVALTTCLTKAPESENCAWLLARVFLKQEKNQAACVLLKQLILSSRKQAYRRLEAKSCQY